MAAPSSAAVRKVAVYPTTKVQTKGRGVSSKPGVGHRVRWRLYRTDGTEQTRKTTFTTADLAKTFVKRLHLAEVGRDGWTFDSSGAPVPLRADDPTGGETAWDLAVEYWHEHWRRLSPSGRKAASYAMSGFVLGTVTRSAGPPPPATQAYLAKLAWHSGRFADDEMPDELRYAGDTYTGAELLRARTWLVSSSTPLVDLSPRLMQHIVNDMGNGQSTGTEQRRWSSLRAMLRWAFKTERLSKDLTRGVSARSSSSHLIEPDLIPTVDEMWRFSWACIAVAGPEWAALPLFLGGCGARIGEATALRRRHLREHPSSGGMWVDLRRSITRTSAAWGEGEIVVARGTKARGPEGNLQGRTTYLPAKEAAIMREHLAQFVPSAADSYVFSTGGNQPLDLAHLATSIWRPAVELAFPAPHRLEGMGRHALRHLAATRWLNTPGMPYKTAQKFGGWRTLSVMLDDYAACLPLDDERAVDAIEGGA